MADISSLLGAAGIGGAIGKAIVSLELETTKYKAELAAAEGQTKASTSSMAGGVSKFGGLASTAYLAAGAAAVAFAAYSVKAAVEANAAHLKLTNTFENNAMLADSSVAAFERQADSLRDLTGVDDEAIISGQALLGQFALTGKQVQELTPRVVDLSEKMGIDLETAFKAVGKATQGNAGVLSRYGITLDTTKLAADGFGTTLEGLGVASGFAADQAKNEPWRVLGAQFEEIAEKLGQALIPLIQNLTDAIIAILPFIEGLITGFMQLGHYVAVAYDALVDFYDLISRGVPVTAEMVDVMGKAAKPFLDTSDAADKAGQSIQGVQWKIKTFANMSKKEIEDWGDKTKEAFDTAVLAMSETEEQTVITRQEFMRSSRIMRNEAEDLNAAMKTIAKSEWVPSNYVKFLSEQGPEWLVGFADLTESEQHRAVQAWRQSTAQTDAAKTSLDKITGALETIGRGKSTHRVEIHYDYVGFDPSKPGMSDPGSGSATGGAKKRP